jgi:hypothetical protein
LFYAHPPIQPWVYPEALKAFHLLKGEKAGMRAGNSLSNQLAKVQFKALYHRISAGEQG